MGICFLRTEGTLEGIESALFVLARKISHIIVRGPDLSGASLFHVNLLVSEFLFLHYRFSIVIVVIAIIIVSVAL